MSLLHPCPRCRAVARHTETRTVARKLLTVGMNAHRIAETFMWPFLVCDECGGREPALEGMADRLNDWLVEDLPPRKDEHQWSL